LKLEPHNAAANYQVGDSYFSLNNQIQALPFLLLAIKQDPGLKAAYKDLGSIYLAQQQYAEAVRLLERVYANDTDGSLNYLLFRAYSRLGDAAKAKASLDRFQTLKAAATNEALFKAELAGRQPPSNPPGPASPPPASTANEVH
jgi:tetratricopeptide (TPR) repeat protein